MPEPGAEKTNVPKCTRCHLEHKGLEFLRLTFPLMPIGSTAALTHWAMCPVTGEPILMWDRKNELEIR